MYVAKPDGFAATLGKQGARPTNPQVRRRRRLPIHFKHRRCSTCHLCPTIQRYRAHVESMLARARKRSRQAQQIVEKWEARLSELDREGVAVRQQNLWQEEQQSRQTSEESDGE